MVGNTLVDVLQTHGFAIDWVQSAEDALRRFQGHPYDLVLTDIELPQTSGIELLRQMRRIQPDARVIVMSGSGPVEPGSFLGEAREAGAAATLTKPFRFSELVQVLRRVLEDVPVPRIPPTEPGTGPGERRTSNIQHPTSR